MAIAPHVSHLVRTACLLESRADQYATYLADVFRPRGWAPVFERWGQEEAHHGAALRGWLAEHEPSFDFSECMTRYATLAYHSSAAGSVYGSPQAELVARCFVEAMAASYYRALGASANEPALQAVCKRLAADEARHFTMFRRLLEALRREEGVRRAEAVVVMLRRMAALSDDQILFASFVVSGRPGAFDRKTEARRYRAMVLRCYRAEDARFVATLLAKVLEAPTPALR